MFNEQQMKEKAGNVDCYATSDGNLFPFTKQGKIDAQSHSFKFDPFLKVYELKAEEKKEEKQPKKTK